MSDEYAERLGPTLAALRRNLGKTQGQMAKKAGVALSTYARHEMGQDAPTAKLLERYSREFGLKPDEFHRLHQLLLMARSRDAEGAGWWMALENHLILETQEDQSVRDKVREYGTLQSDILEVVLGRLRH
jgi:transcriptional regulator with XRE-family HTH domain